MRRPPLMTLALLLLMIVLAARVVDRPPSLHRAEAPVAITLADVAELSELVTLKVPMQHLVEGELVGYLGATRCILIARGEAWISTDLSAAELAFDEAEGIATLTLPPPRVLTATLDQARSGVVIIVRSGLWGYIPGHAGEAHVTDAAYARAQQQMRRAAGDADHIAQARQRTQAVLGDWFQQQGWQLNIQWRSP